MRKEGSGTGLEKGSRVSCCQIVVFPSRQLLGCLQALQQALGVKEQARERWRCAESICHSRIKSKHF